MTIHPFAIAVPQADLDDLQGRLARTRWIDAAQDDGWSYGVELGYMRELVDHWQQRYDWRSHEAARRSRVPGRRPAQDPPGRPPSCESISP